MKLSFFNTGVSYLLSNFPFDNELLKDLGIQPEHRFKPSSSSAIERVAMKLPFADDVALITDERKVYQGEEIDEKFRKTEKDDEFELKRIDHYWRNILKLKTVSGKDKYPRLGKVVKGVLALPHGNADVGLNNIYFEKLSHTNVQNEQSGFGRKLQACKDHLPTC